VNEQADHTSLSALMLSRLRMDVNEALEQYNTVGNDVFAQYRPKIATLGGVVRPKYSTEKIEEALRQVVANGSRREFKRTKCQASKIRLLSDNTDACHT
jgi:hypothetical protein